MGSLLREVLFETSGQAPSPSKDFFHLTVTLNEVVWRWWRISLRVEFRGQAPGEAKMTHEDFLHDSTLQQEVGIIFGSKILEYVQGLCQGQFDYLDRMPKLLLQRILSYLSPKDIEHLSQTSHRFRRLCYPKEGDQSYDESSVTVHHPDFAFYAASIQSKSAQSEPVQSI